jgi:hypothetical protein
MKIAVHVFMLTLSMNMYAPLFLKGKQPVEQPVNIVLMEHVESKNTIAN